MKKIVLILSIFLVCTILPAEEKVIIESSRADTLATIESFSHLGEFHTINYVGDYEYILDFLDNQFLDGNEQVDEMGCSLFSGLGDAENIFLGRNFDNPQQDVLVGKYAAPGCYQSIAVNRLSDMGLPVGTNFSSLTPQQELLLLRAPYFACDGINETGLAVGVAYVDAVPVEVDPNKDSIWLTRWLREILDHAATVDEAITITNSYNILDNFYGQNTLCHHLLITDSSGSSVILEYHDGAFEEIYPDVDWQVLTNTHIYNHTLQQMFNLCYRYQLLYNALDNQNGEIYNWRNGLDILELPTWGNLANGTQWSNLYDTNEEVMYLSLYRDFDNIVRVDIENFEFLNFGNFYLDDVIVQDENNNGLVEPGETVSFVTFISVDFLSIAVAAELSCTDPDIEITSGNFEFGDIQPEQQVSNFTQFFTFEVAETINLQTVEIIINLTTDYGYEFELTVPFAISGVGLDNHLIPSELIDLDIYPNPFNPAATISFNINENLSDAEIAIFNMKGQKVRSFPINSFTDQSANSVTWNGTDANNQPVASGIYYCVLNNNGEIKVQKKMILMK